MRILQVNKFYYLKGGSERYFFDVIDLLKKYEHEVAVFSVKSKKNQASDYEKYFVNEMDFEARQGFFKKIKSAGHIIYSLEAKRKFKKLVQDFKPDIVHLHNFHHQISVSILDVCQKFNIPVVWTLHDYKLICPNYQLYSQNQICEKCKICNYKQAFKNKCLKNSTMASLVVSLEMYLNRFIRQIENRVDLFLAPSQFMRDKVIDWGIDKNKVVKLNNFIQAENFIGSLKNQNYIVYFGRLSQEKGIETLIQAMAKIKTNIKLKIVGGGPLENKLKAQVIDLKLQNKIEFTGPKYGQDLYDLIGQAQFVVVPSEWYENFPYTILESFCLGKPVVGAEIGGIPELVKNQQTGLLFESGNDQSLSQKIDYLIQNPVQIQKMNVQARELVERELSPQKHYQYLIEIYNRLINKITLDKDKIS
ncbi:MAG: glycosyltransferase family 4 protein [Patescibacteria group bacterium]|nr:glycosyltransferase family 4 protein [Patescibacteria group bacterium]